MSGNEWDLTKCKKNWEIQKQYEILWEHGALCVLKFHSHYCAKSILTINNTCRWFLWAKTKGDTLLDQCFLIFYEICCTKNHMEITQSKGSKGSTEAPVLQTGLSRLQVQVTVLKPCCSSETVQKPSQTECMQAFLPHISKQIII